MSDVRVSGAESPVTDDHWYLVAPSGKALDWIHPLVGQRQLPEKSTRRFGAARADESRPDECGFGHCGVDIGWKVGTPVVAVLDGVVERINPDPTHSGGRYVIVKHDNGFQSEYMHLDRISGELKRGEVIKGGTFLGTLGTSGIYNSEPHLHFAVSRPNTYGGRRYVDPEPMLKYARTKKPMLTASALR